MWQCLAIGRYIHIDCSVTQIRNYEFKRSICEYRREFTTINKTVRDAICNFALTPRGAQLVISGRGLTLKAIYPMANFIAACANREEAIIRGSFINAEDPFGASRLHYDLHLYPRSDFI